MNGFELIVRKRNCHKGRKIRFMQESLPGSQAGLHFAGWRRYEGGSSRGTAGPADPVLYFSELAWGSVMAAHSVHQFSVQSSNQANGDGELFEMRNTVLQGNHIIAYFVQIFGAALDCGACLCCQKLAERGLCSFNFAGQNRFATDEWAHQNVGIWKASAFARQSANQPVCFGEHTHQAWRPG